MVDLPLLVLFTLLLPPLLIHYFLVLILFVIAQVSLAPQ